MPTYNRIILAGNLTRDPETRYTSTGLAICKFGLAVNERVKTASGEYVDRPCFVDIDTFSRLAEQCSQALRKGAPVLLEGRLRLETWETNDGQKRSKHTVAADRVEFLGPRPEGAGGAAPPASAPRAPSPAGSAPPAPSVPPLPDGGGDDEDLPF